MFKIVHYYWNPNIPYQNPPILPTQTVPPAAPIGNGGRPGNLPVGEESYIENILRLNKGKLATFYFTFEASKEWNSKIVKGIIEAAGRDHVIVSEPNTGKRYLLLLIYLDYVTFDEEINYF